MTAVESTRFGQPEAADRQGSASGSTSASCGLLTASRRIGLLDYFRVPYDIDPDLRRGELERLRPMRGGPQLLWPSVTRDQAVTAAVLHGADGPLRVFAAIASDDDALLLLADAGGEWSREFALTSVDGRDLGSTWRASDGSMFFPFDVDQVIHEFWSEGYARLAAPSSSRHVRRALMVVYYRLRPLMPRKLQIWSRRQFARVQARTAFPRWPVEPALHEFYAFVLSTVAEFADAPVPMIAPWPNGYKWALVLTHDVEHAAGWNAIEPVLDLERTYGLRSSWNLVPRRYEVDDERVRELSADGFELGVHGLYHDGRDLQSTVMLRKRLPGMREAAERWRAVGFRAPSMHRRWDLMREIGFAYDLSYPDVDPFEPQAGGCCSWLPFFNGDVVELPTTLSGDHTLFVILGHKDEAPWAEKTDVLRERGGLALINTHPDYLLEDRIFSAYQGFLARYGSDDSAWKPLPRDAADWWRRRAASTIERRGDGYTVVGPAGVDARIEYIEPSSGRSRRPA